MKGGNDGTDSTETLINVSIAVYGYLTNNFQKFNDKNNNIPFNFT